jgi:hypothetical protein
LLRSAVGRSARDALIAAWTSRAAPLMLRLMPNCRLMRAEPSELDEVISVTSAIWLRWRSSGLATVVATSSGLAPGSVACTEMVGISTSGSGETGSLKKAMAPAATNPNVSSVVATGRRINGLERLISELDPRSPYTP